MTFCTLFNWLYLPQGLALYRSLMEHTRGKSRLHVLCMDDFVFGALKALDLPNLHPIRLSEIENDELRRARESRTMGEYCWTCTTPLLRYVMAQRPDDEVISYVDADILFFSDPDVILSELGDQSIYVHEHNFSADHLGLLQTSGRFNVGLVVFRNNQEGRNCLERWYDQCIAECVMDPAAGKCGDQNYLDEWPSLYPGLVVSTNPGVGLAPWNISNFRVSKTKNGPAVDDVPVVFYHYHSLRMLRPRFGLMPIALAIGTYSLQPEVISCVYQPYAHELWKTSRMLKKAKKSISGAVPTLPHFYNNIRNDQVLIQISGYSVAQHRNVQMLKALYGIDADREVL